MGFETAEDCERFLRSIVRGEPARAFRKNGDEEEHWEEEDALEDDGDAPRVAGCVGGEGVVDPIDEVRAKVEGGKLHADVEASAGFGGELGLKDGNGGVDEAHAGARDDASYDDVRAGVGGGLEEGAKNHDYDADGDALSSAEAFTNEGGCDSAEEASNWYGRFLVSFALTWPLTGLKRKLEPTVIDRNYGSNHSLTGSTKSIVKRIAIHWTALGD